MAKRRYKNLFKNKAGLWCVDFKVPGPEGRRFIRVIGPSFKEAEEALARLREEKGAEVGKPAGDMVFIDFAKEFMAKYSRLEKRSWKRDETSLKHLNRFFGRMALADINLADVARYKAERKACGKANGEPLAVATINREIALIKKMFNVAVDWGHLEFNRIAKVKMERENNQRERYLTDDEMRDLVSVATDSLRPILIIALSTGMRRGEILALRWEDVHEDEGYLHIAMSKSGKSRNVPMNHQIIAALAGVKRESEYVFQGRKTGRHLEGVKAIFKAACTKAGIKGLRFHDLRHTAASRMVQAGVDLATVSRILGHASITMTMRYAHPTPENMKRAVELMGEALGSLKRKPDERPTALTSSYLYN